MTHRPEQEPEYDRVFLHSRRESIVLLVGFVVFSTWCLGVSYTLGYLPARTCASATAGDEIILSVVGIPHWVFWGVAVPWLGANVFTFWFCLFYMADDPLTDASEVAATSGPASPTESTLGDHEESS